jgi:hypothetical protein
MRTAIVIVANIIVFIGVWYGGVLQDRMRRKASKSGASYFSLGFQLRALSTKESPIFVLLVLAMVMFVAALIALDKAGFLGPS